MRRFYEQADIRADDGGYTVVLDGRPVRTPGKAVLRVPSASLARAIAAEWADQGETIEPQTMPLTRLAATAIDRIAAERPSVVEAVVAYAETDLLCYRADGPTELVERQESHWQPLLDWLEESHGARLEPVAGLMPRAQGAASVERIRAAVEALNDFALSALQSATGSAGSVVVALALFRRRIGAPDAVAISQLDEIYQAELWGDDAEARRVREARAADIEAAARFLELLEEGEE